PTMKALTLQKSSADVLFQQRGELDLLPFRPQFHWPAHRPRRSLHQPLETTLTSLNRFRELNGKIHSDASHEGRQDCQPGLKRLDPDGAAAFPRDYTTSPHTGSSESRVPSPP